MHEKPEKNDGKFVGIGAALGALLGGLVGLVVYLITGDSAVWAWAIPVGVAVGAAIGAGRSKAR